MNRSVLVCSILLCTSAFGQNAVVYRLPENQAKEGKRLHDAAVKAQQEFEKWKTREQQELQNLPKSTTLALTAPELSFTDDFLLAVPKGDVSNGISLIDSSCLHPVSAPVIQFDAKGQLVAAKNP